MSGKPNIHTTYSQQANNWRNISEGASRPGRTYDTKEEARTAGREMAKERHVEHIIHKQNGQIGSRNSYGNDPRERRG